MGTIKSYQEQVQEIVEKAIATVEEQHKALAAASFEYIEKLYKLDTVKAKHDEVSEIAYDKAREVNKLVGGYASDLIAKIEKEEAPAKKAPAKKAAAKKPAAKKAPAKKAAAEA
jgi:peptidoglycan hydrolase CwlO-like protein